jgi:hypothetical protein
VVERISSELLYAVIELISKRFEIVLEFLYDAYKDATNFMKKFQDALVL